MYANTMIPAIASDLRQGDGIHLHGRVYEITALSTPSAQAIVLTLKSLTTGIRSTYAVAPDAAIDRTARP